MTSFFWSPSDEETFDYIYDTAIKAASEQKKEKYLSQLLTSRAFKELAFENGRKTKHFLSKVNEIQEASPNVPFHERGKYSCYLGINYLFRKETKIGVECLKEAMSSLDNCNNPEQTILKLLIFQILTVYYRSLNDYSSSSKFYDKALLECSDPIDTLIFVSSLYLFTS